VWLTINLTWSNAEFYHCSTSCGHSAQFVGEIDDYALLAFLTHVPRGAAFQLWQKHSIGSP